MTVQHAILGFLDWQPLTGYDLKKQFGDSLTHYWSGSNNQIYHALTALHEQGLVSLEVEPQESRPARKVYSITAAGRETLREWLLAGPEMPELRQPFLVQLAWAGVLDGDELSELLAAYEDEIRVQLRMVQERARRQTTGSAQPTPSRTQREEYLWQMIMDNWVTFSEGQLQWVKRVREGLKAL